MKTKNDENYLSLMRHSCEHVLTQAMLSLYPTLQMAMGPATDEGFYFDFDYQGKITEDEFLKIKSEMEKIIKKNLSIRQKFVTVEEARKLFVGNPYKQEWIDEVEKRGEKVSLFYTGNEFVDLCHGPHVSSTGEIGPFKLLSLAGAYWRGDEKNKMLTRIYGACFPTQKELDKHLWRLEEARKRDHRKLGSKLNLFVISDFIGKGLPLFTPKGNIIRQEILNYENKLEKEAGFLHVWTPHIAKLDLYKLTGHWKHYRQTMYSPFVIDNEEYVLKPMNCPHHYAIYSSESRSYKDLPIRICEPGTCYRQEKSGELSGLVRVRSLTIDDSHILMRPDQIEEEFILCIHLVEKMFQAFQLKDYYIRLSLNDPADHIKYLADAKKWQTAGEKLEKILRENKIKYKKEKGEASFYGPKLDYMVKDSLAREWQMSTLQLDLFMAERLHLTYIDKNGKKQHPVILHRGLTGAIERTIGLLIEHYAGAFPLWLSPVQVKIIPISSRHFRYAQSVSRRIKTQDIRVEVDERNETMPAKIRDAQLEKIPYMLIVGDKEVAGKTIAVRPRSGKDLGEIKLADFMKKLKKEINFLKTA